MAKRPPSSWTIGRISGGMTGSTSMIIHSGLLPLRRKASTTSRRLTMRGLLLAGCALLELGVQLLGQRLEVDLLQQLLDGLGAHAGVEIVLILLAHIAVLFFG